jgi:kynurenine formamidase
MHLRELLAEAPTNWGRWGSEDEVGALNLIGPREVLAAVAAVRHGRVITLQSPIGDPGGDPCWPGRSAPEHRMTSDKSSYANGSATPAPGGLEVADDELTLSLQGTTHTDALGHVWFDDQMYNENDADSSVGGLKSCSILPIAEHGVVGRGVLLDVAAHRRVKHLTTGDTITLDELLGCAQTQQVTLCPGDILLIRTGWLATCTGLTAEQMYHRLPEPGLVYEPELVSWFRDTGVAHLVTDTLANEATIHPDTGVAFPLHAALMRNLGIGLTEVAALDALAAACAQLEQYEFLYVAAPLKVHGGTGAPVNPVAVL